jgi:RNA polymerase sigma factor (sigma-70 family)
MSRTQLEPIVRYLRRMTQSESAGVPDQELLARFVNDEDEAAFELLLWRHAAMVLGVCRRVLRDSHTAEDAFQATFLTLARKAETIGKRELVSGWLYKVAYRAALRSKKTNKPLAAFSTLPDSQVLVSHREVPSEASYHEIRHILDEEVTRLPNKYRTSIILCYLQGKTYEEAAQHLGCPKGTVSIRLTRAREMLRTRLTRRGVTLSAGALAVGLSQEFVQAGVPATLITTTLKAAVAFATGKIAAGVVTVQVAQLTQGVLKTMLLKKLTFAGILLATLVVAGTGGGVVLHQALAEKPNEELAIALAPAPSEDIQPKNLLDQALQSVDKIENLDGKAWTLVQIGRALAESSDRAQAAKTFELASRSTRDISNESSRTWMLYFLDVSQAKAGLIDDAFKTAEAIESKTTSHQAQALATIAGEQLRRGDRKGALKTVEQLKETDKDYALSEFARVEAESGDFKKALETSAGIGNGFSRFQALCTIARGELKAGDKEGAREVIQTAFELAKSLGDQRAGGGRRGPRENPPVVNKNSGMRYSALSNIAWLQASAGDIKAAWQTIDLLEKGSFKDSAMVAIIKALADQGKIEEALKMVNDLEGKKDQGFQQIALAQAKAKRFKEALTIATSLERNIRPDIFLQIGKMQARAGDLTGAADSFARALKDLDKPEVLWLKEGYVIGFGPMSVHSALMAYGESGLGKEGVEWANSQTSPFVKAVALAGLAEGVAKRQKREKEENEHKSSDKHSLEEIKELLDQASKVVEEMKNAAEVQAYVFTKIGKVQSLIGNDKDAAKSFDQALMANRNVKDLKGAGLREPKLLLQIADAQIQAGDFESALQTVESFFQGPGGNLEHKNKFLAMVAIAQFKAGKEESAFKTCDKLRDPTRQETLTALAKLQAQQGKAEKAFETIDKYIGNRANHISGLLGVAAGLGTAGDKKAAVETIHKALEETKRLQKTSDDLNNPILFSLAEAAGALAQAGEFKEAFQIADDLDLTFAKQPALVAIAVAQAQTGDIEGARQTLERIRKDKDAVRAEIALAEARAKNVKGALQTAAGLESYEPAVKVLTEIAKLQVRSGDEAAGLASFQKAIDAVKRKSDAEPATHDIDGFENCELLYEIMKAEGEVGVASNALEWIKKEDHPFRKAMALTGLAEGLVPSQKPQAKPKEKQSKDQAAQKDYQIAEFYRRTGHPASARFYYDVVVRRYPETEFGDMAKRRLAESR